MNNTREGLDVPGYFGNMGNQHEQKKRHEQYLRFRRSLHLVFLALSSLPQNEKGEWMTTVLKLEYDPELLRGDHPAFAQVKDLIKKRNPWTVIAAGLLANQTTT